MASEPAEKSVPWPPVIIWAVRILIAAAALYNLKLFFDYLPGIHIPDGNLMNYLDAASIYIVAPLGGAIGLVLAAMGRRLMLAAILVCIVPVYWGLSVVAFIIAVMIYGF